MLPVRRKGHQLSGPAEQDGGHLAQSDAPGPF